MRVLYLDVDTLRADHLGCYGYGRDTSPNIDRIAAQGVRFENCYVSDAPCLPSRASLFTGRFGIHSGVVNHGGSAADLRIEGPERAFRSGPERNSWVAALRACGLYPVTVSPFAERHSAWWFYHGFRECYNPGKGGMERADEVVPYALDWIERHGREDDWFLHVNLWDPHTPYRTPASFGRPFEGAPIQDWMTEERIQWHVAHYGPHSPRDLGGFGPGREMPLAPAEIRSLDDYQRWIEGYDTGIRYADHHVGLILDALKAQGVLDETVILFSSDHGENQGELCIYGDHHTADHITSRVPFVVRWPGVAGGRVDAALHYQNDLAATVLELLGGQVPATWDGVSFADAFRGGREAGRDFLVVSQCAWSCQRSVRWGPHLFVRTYHDGLKDFPEWMLFDVEADPHETESLVQGRADLVGEGLGLLDRWHAEMMAGSESQVDPMWNVMREGGPYHTRGQLDGYCRRLVETGRGRHAEALQARHGEAARARYGARERSA